MSLRDAGWIDYDGTITGLFPGERTNIGSDWAGTDWWYEFFFLSSPPFFLFFLSLHSHFIKGDSIVDVLTCKTTMSVL